MQFPSLEQKIGLNWTGPYEPGAIYYQNDVVSYLSTFYVVTAVSTMAVPTDTGSWDLYRDSTVVDDALGAVPSTYTFSADAATTTEAGVVIVPTAGNIEVDGSGNISVDVATTTELGLVIVPTSGHLSVDGSGNVTVNASDVPLLASNNTFAGTTTLGKALYPAVVTPTYAATVSLNPVNGNVFVINALHATSDACTANLASSPLSGEELSVIVSSNHADPEITFGTHFKSSATVKPGANKTIVVKFVSNGTDAIETSRSAAV